MHRRKFSVSVFVAALASGATACAEYRESGEFVRHHFGYVKVIAPAIHAPDTAVRALEVETYGLWVGIDGDATPEGGGFGYQHVRRELIPLDCRVVARVATRSDIDYFVSLLRRSNIPEGGICAIQDASLQY